MTELEPEKAFEREQLVKRLMDKHYIGDGAYVHHDGFNVWLTTSDGTRDTNRVCLEPSVMASFEAWMKTTKGLIAEIGVIDNE